ncbi:MAG: hypothetical protein H6812_00595 [Phycisphaeraceae bacterium]|nr:hypothetical protein [Phycisphaerales bacterium]MCB9841734.1 hypothetical protein [Phycisphaeraceae bacterium]
MRGMLIRVGADQTKAGGWWNAPVDASTGNFLYIPIPERDGTDCHPSFIRRYEEWYGPLKRFLRRSGTAGTYWQRKIGQRLDKTMHLDPDFEHLTYGDMGARRGRQLAQFNRDDLLVFYSGLRSISDSDSLVYAIIGVYIIDEIVIARSVSNARLHENAHSRRISPEADEIVIRARPGMSGRCSRCVPIGERRGSNYYLRPDIEQAWGGLMKKDGSPRGPNVTRSGVPPLLASPHKFMEWWQRQGVLLVQNNHD